MVKVTGADVLQTQNAMSTKKAIVTYDRYSIN
jgi:hypothetical protein